MRFFVFSYTGQILDNPGQILTGTEIIYGENPSVVDAMVGILERRGLATCHPQLWVEITQEEAQRYDEQVKIVSQRRSVLKRMGDNGFPPTAKPPQ